MEYSQIKYMLAEYIRQLYTLTDLVCKLQQCKLGYRSSELSRKPADLILTQILLGLISVPCIRQILHLQKAGFLHSCFVRFVSAMHRLVPCESLVSGMDYEIFFMVPRAGIEPACPLQARDFKSLVSTYFTIRAINSLND